MTTFLLALAAVTGVNDNLNPRQFQIGITFYKGDPLGCVGGRPVEVLARPQLRVRNGHAGVFQAGDNHPIPEPDGKVSYIAVGVAAKLTPTKDGDRIRLEGDFQLSEVNKNFGIKVGDQILPGFSVRSARPNVITSSGQTFRVRIAADSPQCQTWAEVTVTELPRGK